MSGTSLGADAVESTAPRTSCKELSATVGEKLACIKSGSILVVGKNKKLVRRLADIAKQSEANFSRQFQSVTPTVRSVSPTAIVVTAGVVTAGDASGPIVAQSSGQLTSKLQLDGWPVLPWFDLEGPAGSAVSLDLSLPLAHELGHLWFITKYWPSKVASTLNRRSHEYGSNAPDWFDEVAAMSVETNDFSDGQFKEALAAAVATPAVIAPLPQYFGMHHPDMDALLTGMKLPTKAVVTAAEGAIKVEQAKAGANTGLTTVVESFEVDENSPQFQAQIAFYTQSRLFLQFLSDQANKPGMLDAIASNYRDGKTLEAWLPGQTFGLPTSIAELESAWQRWLVDSSSRPE